METTSLPSGGIVAGVDGSAAGDRALSWAAEEAALERRPLVLVHAIGSLGTPGTVWLTDADRVVQEIRASSEEILEAAARQVETRHPALDVHTRVVTADARQALLRVADDAAMVVVGSRGRGPVRSLVLGSVSSAVGRHAPCPVVVVRPHHPGTVRRGVLVGADGSSDSLGSLEFAYREASIRGLPLTVMHCVWDVLVSVTSAHAVAPSDPTLEEARLLLAESVAGMTEKYPDVHVTLELSRGLPEQALGVAADRMDLLVVGRSNSGTMARALFGDVSGSLLEHARTAIAIVPDTGTNEHRLRDLLL